MEFGVFHHRLPKAGHDFDECADNIQIEELPIDSAYSTDAEANSTIVPLLRAAIADGATDSAFPSYWSALLVNAYSKGMCESDSWADALAEIRQLWQEHADARAKAWYVREKVVQGAFSTLVGVTFYSRADRPAELGWRVCAVGDSCIFIVRENSLIKSIPIDDFVQFRSRPYLLATNEQDNLNLEEKLRHHTGVCSTGDQFLLMSDALACWFLRRQSQHGDAILVMNAIVTAESLEDLVHEQRAARCESGYPAMRNDDVAFVRIEIK